MGAVLAGVMGLGVVALAAAAIFYITRDDGEASVAAAEEPASPSREGEGEGEGASEESAAPAEPAAQKAGASPTEASPATAKPKPVPKSPEEFTWTTEAPATLKELSRAWSIPGDVLAKLNPKLPAERRIKAGTRVTVHTPALGSGFSVGPPNDGRLTRGVPLPEGKAWLLPADRTRAFATSETIAALTAGLVAYGRQYPEAVPIQVGDLSARRGGKLFGHQSHQTGRDADIRLIRDATGEGFDPERNWFLIKTLIDGSDVRVLFLNAREQTWLRSAAEADVGAAQAAEYFAIIRHEPGHTIHTHVRFGCPKDHKRCVPYPLPDTEEQDPKRESKLPPLPGGKQDRGKSKLPPGIRPKGGGGASDKKKKGKKGKKKGKKGKKKGG